MSGERLLLEIPVAGVQQRVDSMLMFLEIANQERK